MSLGWVWMTLPKTTCSTASGSTFARSSAALAAMAPSSVGGTSLRLLPYEPTAVRAAELITTLVTGSTAPDLAVRGRRVYGPEHEHRDLHPHAAQLHRRGVRRGRRERGGHRRQPRDRRDPGRIPALVAGGRRPRRRRRDEGLRGVGLHHARRPGGCAAQARRRPRGPRRRDRR